MQYIKRQKMILFILWATAYGLYIDSWVTLDLWVRPYSIIALAIQNMMKEISFNITIGSRESFITLCVLQMQALCQCSQQSHGFEGTPKFVAYYGQFGQNRCNIHKTRLNMSAMLSAVQCMSKQLHLPLWMGLFQVHRVS